MNTESLIRPSVRALTPYRSARQDHSRGILLDANENAFGSAVDVDGLPLNRYPDPFQRNLRERLALMNGTTDDRVFVGAGSDEVIDLLVRIFCEPVTDSVVILEPTYGMYRVAAAIQGTAVRSCRLTEDFQVDRGAVARVVDGTTKIIFCCSPNNPTGNLLRTDDILALCASHPAIVVVDEAYMDFSSSRSLAEHLDATPNLVLLRTLSKAWGMAAIRLGYGLASPMIVGYLMKVKSPYNINALTARVALQALDRTDEVRETVAVILRERSRLAGALTNSPHVVHVFPSEANFLLVRFRRAAGVHAELLRRGIVVRDRSSEPMLANCLRITVGTPEENDTLLSALKEFSP